MNLMECSRTMFVGLVETFLLLTGTGGAEAFCDYFGTATADLLKCPVLLVTEPSASTACTVKVGAKLADTPNCASWVVRSTGQSATTAVTGVEVTARVMNSSMLVGLTKDNYEKRSRELEGTEEKIDIPAGTGTVDGNFKELTVPKTCKDGNGGDEAALPCTDAQSDELIVVLLEKDDKVVGFATKVITLDCTDATTTDCSGANMAPAGNIFLLLGSIIMAAIIRRA